MIIVFVGPSISLTEAKVIMPEAVFLPPVRCGDILRVMRFKPKKILIIDGYFENTASVWHKEILAAIAQGVTVVGASSMGALRAAELTDFGMIGVGKIFSMFAGKVINDDDEVTVLHKSAAQGYETVSDAMVNIRFTIEHAIANHIISPELANHLIVQSKAMFYQKRSLKVLINQLIQERHEDGALQIFLNWLEQGGYVDQKCLDAKQALQQISTLEHTQTVNFKLSHTALLNNLQREVSCQPFPIMIPELSITENVASVSRLLGNHYRYIKRIASLLAMVKADNNPMKTQQNQTFTEALHNLQDVTWCKSNDLTSQQAKEYYQRFESIAESVPVKYNSEAFVLMFIRLNGDYAKYKAMAVEHNIEVIKAIQQFAPDIFKLVGIIGCLWAIVKNRLPELKPSQESIMKYLRQFKTKFKLSTKEQFNEWLQAHDLDYPLFFALLEEQIMYDYIVVRGNTSLLGECNFSHWWFLDALYLTDYYREAKKILTDHGFKESALANNRQILEDEHDRYAFKQDFHGGYDEMQAFLRVIKDYDLSFSHLVTQG